MAYLGTSIYIDGINISDDKFDSRKTFEITSTGLIVDGVQVWTYSGNLIFNGFTQTFNYPIGTTGHLTNFTITSDKIYLNTWTHAEYYKVSYTDLRSVANAVRHKLGIASQLEFPIDFANSIEEIPSGGANTAVIDIDVANGTATITSGEFPYWCTGINSDYIWGTIYINNGFVAGDIDNSADIECRVSRIFTDEGISGVEGISINNWLRFGIITDLSMIGFIVDSDQNPNSFVPMTSGTFEIILIYCDSWSSGTTDEPTEPIAPSPIDDDTIK